MNKSLKYILMVLFFPITLTYLIWKQDNWTGKGKVIATIALWILFIGVGSGGNGGNTTTVSSSPIPSPVQQEEKKSEFTLEQKQDDFKKIYQEYQKKGQALILIKATVANMKGSREELYVALDKASSLLGNVVSLDNKLVIPDSLVEYKSDLNKASSYLMLTGTAYDSAIKNAQTYLNKGDLEAYKKVKDESDRGDQNLLTSSEAIEKVAKELGVDISLIKPEE